MEKGLAKTEAERRSKAVSNVSYDLAFDLTGVGDDFSGQETLRFTVHDPNVPLTLDFEGGKIDHLMINGAAVADVSTNAYFISLPPLQAGKNEISMHFTHPYSRTGSGLYRFKDPEDGLTYVFSDFEPFRANWLFPAFDQPDLKATFKVSAAVPQDWTVLTSVRESAVDKADAKRVVWTFPESAKFSTYLFSLVAGPFHVFEDKAGDIPLRLLARRSLAKFVPAKDWLTVTKQGLDFYGTYFDYPYPFKKYDQIIVPDFNAGAMENVANVTFSERYVPRGAVTNSDRENLADTVLHEMAHQWFGDLVTMRWWNDLWLNESFATYMATVSLVQATEFKGAWDSFYQGTKQWAYWEDQQETTHPIEGHVPSTEEAFAAFDGITYGKGAASLKALSFRLGPDVFRAGVRGYFKRHAFGNATRADFMEALGEAAGRNLTSWSEQWLGTAGLNTVSFDFECKGGKTAGFALKQTAPFEHPTLREHRTKVAFLAKSARGFLEVKKVVDVTYAGDLTKVPALDGQPCPALVQPNFEDHDYVKTRLDARSLATVKADLAEVAGTLDRSMYWASLWDMVRDGEWPATAYGQLLVQNVRREKDDKILEKVLGTVTGKRRASLFTYLPLSSQAGGEFSSKFETLAWQELNHQKPGTDAQKLWLESYVEVARSMAAQDRLRAFLDGKAKMLGLDLDQDRRWLMIEQLAEVGARDGKLRRENEAKRDASQRGRQSAIAAEAILPEAAIKDAWYQRIVDPKTSVSLADLKTAMGHLYPVSQMPLRKAQATNFYRDLPKLALIKEDEFLGRYSANLAPAYCDQESVAALRDFIKTHTNLPPVVVKNLTIAAQEDERCVRARRLTEKTLGMR